MQKFTGVLLLVSCTLFMALIALPGAKAQSSPAIVSDQPYLLQRVQPSQGVYQSGPLLQISSDRTATTGSIITLPISYIGDDTDVSSIAFSLDIDQVCLAFDPSDYNENGLPDAITFHTPLGINVLVAVDLTDDDGELDIIIADFIPPFAILPDLTPLFEVRLKTVCQAEPGKTREAVVRFSADPEPSFGNTDSEAVSGQAFDGLVTIVGPPLPPTTTATPTLAPTRPTATPTLVLTAPPMTYVNYFRAVPQHAQIHLQWQTQWEADTAGFYIYRKPVVGQNSTRDFSPISPLLPGQGAQGGAYTFTDQDVQVDARYLYLLVEEKTNGVRTEFIQLIITSSLAGNQPYQLLLPLIVR